VIVVDASVLLTALADDGADGTRARQLLDGRSLAAPELIDLEVVSVLRRLVRSGNLSVERADLALGYLDVLPLQRAAHRPLVRRVWELRDTVSAYDAAYVALAELLDAELWTADAKLVRSVGPRCPLVMIGAE
jgi:predicted nucleic acid-binding protein